jgi:hypothetical protein
MDERSIKQSLITVRIIWAALLVGQLFFLAIIIFVMWPSNAHTSDARTLTLLFYISVAMLVMSAPIAWFVRGAIYRGGRVRAGTDSGVPPQAYVTGNIVFLSMFEGASFVGLVGMFLNGRSWPHLVVPLIAMAIQVLNFPTGAPMHGNGQIGSEG